jgi:hypothetical protein
MSTIAKFSFLMLGVSLLSVGCAQNPTSVAMTSGRVYYTHKDKNSADWDAMLHEEAHSYLNNLIRNLRDSGVQFRLR